MRIPDRNTDAGRLATLCALGIPCLLVCIVVALLGDRITTWRSLWITLIVICAVLIVLLLALLWYSLRRAGKDGRK